MILDCAEGFRCKHRIAPRLEVNMSVRLLLTDSIWKRIEKVLNEIKSKVGRPPDISDRMFIEAVLYIARTGIPWRDLPDFLGNFSTIYNRLRRWKLNGIWSPTVHQEGSNYGNDSKLMRYHWLRMLQLPKRNSVTRSPLFPILMCIC